MAHLVVRPDGDGAFPELQGRKIHTTERISVTGLQGGMKSGKPSVGIIIELPNGEAVFAETSLALFVMAARALVARHGDPTDDNWPPPTVPTGSEPEAKA